MFMVLWLVTEQIRFGWITNEIINFSILDEKNAIHNFGQNLNEKWPTDRQKIVKFFHLFVIHWL